MHEEDVDCNQRGFSFFFFFFNLAMPHSMWDLNSPASN